MLIVRQDGTEVFNFDRVTNTWIGADVLDSRGDVFEICADGETLGYYKTEERAKEVFKEIQERYEHTQYLKCFNRMNDLYEVGIKDFIYQMPKE